jgi:hypothetical protein
LLRWLINWFFFLSISTSKVFSQVNLLLLPFICLNKIFIVLIEIVYRFWFLFEMVPMAFGFCVLIPCKSLLLISALLVVEYWVLMFLLQWLKGLGFWDLIVKFEIFIWIFWFYKVQLI